jgi:hypothetical protein
MRLLQMTSRALAALLLVLGVAGCADRSMFSTDSSSEVDDGRVCVMHSPEYDCTWRVDHIEVPRDAH